MVYFRAQDFKEKRILERSHKKHTKQKKIFSAIKQTRCIYYVRVLNLQQNNPKFFF